MYPHEIIETEKLAGIVSRIAKATNPEIEIWLEEISTRQPFLFSLYKGWQLDFTAKICSEILRFLIVIWVYYRDEKFVRRLDAETFEAMELGEMKMIKLFEDYSDSPEGENMLDFSYGSGMPDRVLLAYVFGEVLRDSVFKHIDEYDRSIFLVGIKALIKCLHTLKSPVK